MSAVSLESPPKSVLSVILLRSTVFLATCSKQTQLLGQRNYPGTVEANWSRVEIQCPRTDPASRRSFGIGFKSTVASKKRHGKIDVAGDSIVPTDGSRGCNRDEIWNYEVGANSLTQTVSSRYPRFFPAH